MREPEIDPDKLETWASFLIEHSLGGVTPGDRVMIKGERIGWPLMEILERKVIEAGGVPDVHLVAPNNERGRVWSAAMARGASEIQLESVPDWHRARYESMTKYIEVLGAEDPSGYAGLETKQAGALAKADSPFSKIRLSKPWVITLYPTPAMAAMEGMSLEEYTEFIVGASTTDPAPLLAAEERIAPLLDRGRTVRIVTEHPEEKRELTLTMEIEPCRSSMSYGRRNFPDGEVYTSPDARSPEGEIFLDLPGHYGGVDIEGVYLKLENGGIVEYSARSGGHQLEAIIETDAGSRRLGEVAWGMNPGFDRVLKHPLFVEKVGGTMHIAIGASYAHCYVEDPSSEEGKQRLESLRLAGVLNTSAQHVDIVTDFREGGCGRRVFIDETELVVESGVWVPLPSPQ